MPSAKQGLLGDIEHLRILFYEVVVIPIYIMVIICGSTKRVTKEYAGMKLTIFLLIGSAFLLVGVIDLFAFCQQMSCFRSVKGHKKIKGA